MSIGNIHYIVLQICTRLGGIAGQYLTCSQLKCMYVYIPASHFICEWLCAIEHRDSEQPDHELLQKASAKYKAPRPRNASSVEKNKKLLNWGHFKGAFLLFINRVLITHELFVSFCKHPFSRHSELAGEVHGTPK